MEKKHMLFNMRGTYLYCYTRTKYIDYRHVFGLSYMVCPEEVQDVFTNRIRAILNQTDDTNLSTPVYVFFREENFVLYGVACLNCILSREYCKDKTNGSVRGFLGILVNTSVTKVNCLQNSIDFYKALYQDYITPVWESYTFQYEEDKEIDTSYYSVSKCIVPSHETDKINMDNHRCRLFSNSWDGDILLAEALSAKTNISIAINLDHERQATMPDYNPLMNAQMKYSIDGSLEDRDIVYRCNQCRKLVEELYHGGKCYSCWNEQNVPKPQLYTCQQCGAKVFSLQDGLCEECNKKQDSNNHSKEICMKCGSETDYTYTRYRLCEKCYAEYAQKQKLKKIFFPIVVVILLSSILIWYFYPIKQTKPSKFKSEQNSTSVLQDSLMSTSIPDSTNIHEYKNLQNNCIKF